MAEHADTAENDVPPCPACGGNMRFCECMDDPFAPVPESAENGLRPDVTPEAVVALRLAADNMPISRPGQQWSGAADWLRRRAREFEVALASAARPRLGSPQNPVDGATHPCPTPGYAGRHTAVGAGAISPPYVCHGCGTWFLIPPGESP